jgi:aconitate hydratase
VLPLTFADPSTYDQIEEHDKLSFLDLAELAPGKPVYAEIVKPDGTRIGFETNHTMNDEQIAWFRAGGALNIIRQRSKG